MTSPPLGHLVAEGRSLLAEATLGEWKATPPSGPWPANYWAVGTTADGLLERFTSEVPENAHHDARAIAWAMTNLPHLLVALHDAGNEIIRLQNQANRVEALVVNWENLIGKPAMPWVRGVRTALEGDHTA